MATVTYPLSIGSFIPSATVPPEQVRLEGTNFPEFGYAFADATNDEIMYSERLFIPNYGSGNVSALVDWRSRTGQTTGAVVLGAALSVLTPGDAQSVATDAFATENTQTTTVSGTASALNRTTITISNLDSLAANDSLVLRIARKQSNGSDTMTGDCIIEGVTLQYSDT